MTERGTLYGRTYVCALPPPIPVGAAASGGPCVDGRTRYTVGAAPCGRPQAAKPLLVQATQKVQVKREEAAGPQ